MLPGTGLVIVPVEAYESPRATYLLPGSSACAEGASYPLVKAAVRSAVESLRNFISFNSDKNSRVYVVLHGNLKCGGLVNNIVAD